MYICQKHHGVQQAGEKCPQRLFFCKKQKNVFYEKRHSDRDMYTLDNVCCLAVI
jgi:hypothetical protein